MFKRVGLITALVLANLAMAAVFWVSGGHVAAQFPVLSAKRLLGGGMSAARLGHYTAQASLLSETAITTWTHTTQADWENGVLERVDSATLSGSLQLASRLFGDSDTISPPEELGAGQQYPDVALDPAGNAYAVWQDGRDGQLDIRFAYRPAGGVWGGSVRVNDDPGIARQTEPAIAVDAAGNAYAMWTDGRDGGTDIYFAYRPAGGEWGDNVRVDDDHTANYRGGPAISVDAAGYACSAWGDYRQGHGDVYLSCRPPGGSWSTNTRLNDDAGATEQYSPDVTFDATGRLHVAWVDKRTGTYEIFAAVRSAEGVWEANARVSDDAPSPVKMQPSIAVDSTGTAHVVWYDYRNSIGDIYYASRPDGGDWSPDAPIDDEFYPFQSSPELAVDANDTLYLVWQHRETLEDVFFAYRTAISTTWSTRTRVNDDVGEAYQTRPALAVGAAGNAMAVWIDQRHGNPDIYGAARPAGGTWQANARVDDDVQGGASQGMPSLSVDGVGNITAVWEDLRSGDNDVYAADRPSTGGWSPSVRVNDDSGEARQYLGRQGIAVDAAGNACAIWSDDRDGWDIRASCRPVGEDWNANVRVNDDTDSASQFEPAIAMDAAGNAIAVWSDYRDGESAIYSALRPAGGDWGANMPVVANPGVAPSFAPALAIDAVGNTIAVWLGDSLDAPQLYAAYRTAISTTWSSSVRVSDDDSVAGGYPAVAIDAAGNAIAAWTDRRDGGRAIYAAYRPYDGEWGTNVRVDSAANGQHAGAPALVVDDSGTAYAVWNQVQYVTGEIMIATRPAGGDWSNSLQVDDDPGTTTESAPTLAIDPGGTLHALWADRRYDAGQIRHARSLDVSQFWSEGTYTSPELDSGVTVAAWGALTWQGVTPAGTSLAFETRSRLAGGAWSMWEPVSGAISSPPGQVLQYRVTFATHEADNTPVLDQVQISYSSAATPSAPQFATPDGLTNQTEPTISGWAAGGSTVHLTVDGGEEVVAARSAAVQVVTVIAGADGTFVFSPTLGAGVHTLSATAENDQGQGPASGPLVLTVDSSLSFDPVAVRGGQWSPSGWLMAVPRDASGVADPMNNWRVWPRADQPFRVEVPVHYTTSAAVTATLGAETLILAEASEGLFIGVFEPLISAGDFVLEIVADGATDVIQGQAIVDAEGVIFQAGGTLNDAISGVHVTCLISDTHSGQWLPWNASQYGQVNPQVTTDNGQYSFYPPPGIYRVMAEKEGYPIYISADLFVLGAPLRHNIEYGYASVYLPLVIRQ